MSTPSRNDYTAEDVAFWESMDAAIEKDGLEKPVRFITDHTKFICGHEFPQETTCIPTWQRGADGTMWLECQHLRWLVEE